MRKNLLLGVTGGGIVAVGLLAGMLISGAGLALVGAQAGAATQTSGTTSPSAACSTYEQAMANKLHTSVKDLEEAQVNAAQSVLTQLKNNHNVTQAQFAELQNIFQPLNVSTSGSSSASATHLCSNSGQVVQNAVLGLQNASWDMTLRTHLLNAVAKQLHIGTGLLQSQLASGMSIDQIASKHNVSVSAVNNAYMSTARTQYQQAVRTGLITQAQAQAALNATSTATHAGFYPFIQNIAVNGVSFGGVNQVGNNPSNPPVALTRLNNAVQASVATKIGITPSALMSRLQQGKTVQQIAAAHNASLSDVNNAYLYTTHFELKQAVLNHKMTQSQANTLYNAVRSALHTAGFYLLLGAS